MPVYMRCHIAQTREVDFVYYKNLSQCSFHAKHRPHQLVSLFGGEIGKFLYVRIPDYAAKTWIGIRFSPGYPDHTPPRMADDHLTAIALTQLAAGHRLLPHDGLGLACPGKGARSEIVSHGRVVGVGKIQRQCANCGDI